MQLLTVLLLVQSSSGLLPSRPAALLLEGLAFAVRLLLAVPADLPGETACRPAVTAVFQRLRRDA